MDAARMHAMSPYARRGRVVVPSLRAAILLLFIHTACTQMQGVFAVNSGKMLRMVVTGNLRGNADSFVGTDALYGGYSRIAMGVHDATNNASDSAFVLRLDIGNWLGTTLFDQVHSGKLTLEIFTNSLLFHVKSLSHGDFQQGPDILADTLAAVPGTTVLSNARFATYHRLSTLVNRYAVVNVTSVAGETLSVGVVSYASVDLCTFGVCYDGSGPLLKMLDPAESVQSAISEMKRVHPYVSVVVCAVNLPPPIGVSVLAGVAAKITGVHVYAVAGLHLSGVPDLIYPSPAGPYPMSIPTADVGFSAALFSSTDYRYLTIADVSLGMSSPIGAMQSVTLSGQGPLAIRNCSALAIANNLTCTRTVDASVQTVVDVGNSVVTTYKVGRVGATVSAVNGALVSCRATECTMGNLLADAMRWRTGGLCDVAIFGVGSIRASFAVGNITIANVLDVVRFRNTISIVTMTGKGLVVALENSVSIVPRNISGTWPSGSGRFSQVSGMRFTYDNRKAPYNGRIIRAAILGENGTYDTLHANRLYKICMLDFVRFGGDNYTVFTNNAYAFNPYDYGPETQSMAIAYVTERSPINITLEGRITIDNNYTSLSICELYADDSSCLPAVVEPVSGGGSLGPTVYVPIAIGGAIALVAVFAILLYLRKNLNVQKHMKERRNVIKQYIALSELEFGRELGRGAAGVVYLGLWRNTTVAIKKCKRLQDWFEGDYGGANTPKETNDGMRSPKSARMHVAHAIFGQTGSGLSGMGSHPPSPRAGKTNNGSADTSGQTTPNWALSAHTLGYSMQARRAVEMGRQNVLDSFTSLRLIKSSSTGERNAERSGTRYSFEAEIAIMCNLRHPALLLYIGMVPSPNLCVVTEFMPNGSLRSCIDNPYVVLPWTTRFNISLDIARGMSYLHLHDPPIFHCDLKSMNILLGKDWNAKIGDFGMTQSKAVLCGAAQRVGTLFWMAPEVLKGMRFTEKSDVFSFGVTVWELVTRKFPYADHSLLTGSDLDLLLDHIVNEGTRPTAFEMPSGYAALLSRCWKQDDTRRPSFPDLLHELELQVAEDNPMWSGEEDEVPSDCHDDCDDDCDDDDSRADTEFKGDVDPPWP